MLLRCHSHYTDGYQHVAQRAADSTPKLKPKKFSSMPVGTNLIFFPLSTSGFNIKYVFLLFFIFSLPHLQKWLLKKKLKIECYSPSPIFLGLKLIVCMCGSSVVQLESWIEHSINLLKGMFHKKKQRKTILLQSSETHCWLLQVFKEPLKQVEYKFERKRSDPFSSCFTLGQALDMFQAFLKSLTFFPLTPFFQLGP